MEKEQLRVSKDFGVSASVTVKAPTLVLFDNCNSCYDSKEKTEINIRFAENSNRTRKNFDKKTSIANLKIEIGQARSFSGVSTAYKLLDKKLTDYDEKDIANNFIFADISKIGVNPDYAKADVLSTLLKAVPKIIEESVGKKYDILMLSNPNPTPSDRINAYIQKEFEKCGFYHTDNKKNGYAIFVNELDDKMQFNDVRDLEEYFNEKDEEKYGWSNYEAPDYPC